MNQLRWVKLTLLVGLLLGINSFSVPGDTKIDTSDINLNQIPSTELEDIDTAIRITQTSNNSQSLNLFALWRVNSTVIEGDYLIVLDNEGNILTSFKDVLGSNQIPDGVTMAPEFINSTTVFFQQAYNTTDPSLLLWNLESGETELLPIPAGHHDVEYNPQTDTFLTMQEALYGTYQDQQILYDDLYEFDRQGNVVWYWNMSEHIPFDESLYLNETFRGHVDWSHANAIFWDFEEGSIFLNSRTLDAFYKIDYNTGIIDWKAGKQGDFLLYDDNGKERSSLWYHSHAIEKISNNRFIMFDNDFFNLTNGDAQSGRSRYLEIEIDEQDQEIHQIWDWTAPSNYFIQPLGDADRLPNGNTVGVFGFWLHPTYITEVNKEGEIVWEARIDFLNDNQTRWGVYRTERYYERPQIMMKEFSGFEKQSSIRLQYHDLFKKRYSSSGRLSIWSDSTSILETEVDFLPYWQMNDQQFNLGDLRSYSQLNMTLTNADGVSNFLYIKNEQTSRIPYWTIGTLVAPLMLVVLRRRYLKSSV